MRTEFRQLALALLFVAIAVGTVNAQSTIEAEEYAVYIDLLKLVYADDMKSEFVIAGSTSRVHHTPDAYIKGLVQDPDVIRDFVDKGKKSAELHNKFKLKSKTVILDPGSQNRLEHTHGSESFPVWAEFKKTYNTRGLLYLSRVGFNKHRNKALVIMGLQIGDLNGEGSYYLLVKGKKGWMIEKTVGAWIS